MTTSAITSASSRQRRQSAPSFAAIANLAGVIAGGILALVSLVGWGSPIGFFSGVAGAFYCLDAVRRQSW
ncbi:MAG: hypothetical protein K2L05_06020 [Muribaculaceae bacterium]|nr:hypothetical protein [Muribaculaceae bacterium]